MTELKGILNQKVADFFGLKDNKMVYIGEQNILHMKNKHYSDYETYYQYLSEIVNSPDYVGKNPRDESLELIKEFFCEESNSYVKVAVRVSKNQTLFIRTLYSLNSSKFEYQVSKGYYQRVENL